jgi:hypothetical protein
MSEEIIGLSLGVVSGKLTPEQKDKANRALKHAYQKHITELKKQRRQKMK